MNNRSILKNLSRILLGIGFFCLTTLELYAQSTSDLLKTNFSSPPNNIHVGTFWYWVSDNISKEGVIEDLHAMKKAGINLAFIGIIGPSTHHNANYPFGKVKFMTEEWWDILHVALKTATDLDIEIGIFNSPGWSQSGGPWVKPEQTMRFLDATEVHVTGPKKFSEKLSAPKELFQDVKVLAFRAERKNLLDDPYGKITISDNICQQKEIYQLPLGDSSISLTLADEATARGILIYSGDYLNTSCVLQVKIGDEYQNVKEFSLSRDVSIETQKGFNQKAPVVESLPESTSKKFRLLFKNTKGKSVISSIILTPSPVVQRYPGKIFAKAEDTGKLPPALNDSSLFVCPQKVLDISEHLAVDGTLTWDVPKGEWTILRTGMTPTRVFNSPTSPEAMGWEMDKMNKKLIFTHFKEFLGKIYDRIPADDRKCWKYTVLDSYEKGGQNITDGMLETFKRRYGYDPVPFLPTYYGYPVGNYELSERFLWDMRRLVADEIAYEYVGGLTEISHQYGLRTWLENYGHGGFSAEFLQYGGQSDEVAGEFWNERHVAEKRASASCAHIYNKPKVWAEAFTNEGRDGSAFQRYPGMLKSFGDLAFATGTNSMLLHVYIQQYADNSYPGVDAWFGTEFNRKNTWFGQMDMFVQYLKRTSFLLQQGQSVADVAYYIGENTPIMTGSMKPELPQGYYFDFINSEVLINDLQVVDGRLVLPHGISYRVLVLPPQKMMRPAVLKKLEKLVSEGATIMGLPPSASPSLQDYPQCDKEIQELSAKMWALSDSNEIRGKQVISYGKGNILVNMTLEEAFDLLKVIPDCRMETHTPILYSHRTVQGKEEIYFLTNQSKETVRFAPQFRVSGMQPELWDATTGTTRLLSEFKQIGETTIVPLQLEPSESVFIVFKEQKTIPSVERTKNFPEAKTFFVINTPWAVQFESDEIKRGPKETVIFRQLDDWTKNSDKRIKYFSGTAHYETKIKLPELPDGKLYLDLGKVAVMAKVKVNDKEVGGVWTAPYRVEITDVLQKGINKIEVEIVNTWINRILGDMLLPKEERKLTPHTIPWKKNTPLQTSGLIGPVKIVYM